MTDLADPQDDPVAKAIAGLGEPLAVHRVAGRRVQWKMTLGFGLILFGIVTNVLWWTLGPAKLANALTHFLYMPLAFGFGLVAGALLWLPASEALSAAAGPIGGPRVSSPGGSIGSFGNVGPRSPSFRVNPTGPKDNPTTGNPTTGNPDTGKPPKDAGRKPPKKIVVIPPGGGGQPPAQQLSSGGTPNRRAGTGVSPAGEHVLNEVVIELDGTKVVQLSAGAQIRDPDNRLVLPTSLTERTVVRYLVDGAGDVHRVWILSAREIAQLPPPPFPK